ncbi:hypothetical protein [Polaribacter butkevichii]|uniref:Uncharacterized protein n=1 Tax=Polaribacter butkevichii TaxID=218490 RepID=A0A2P6CFC7_9FLAO|nr:hypothetical protein [Polaribacter butkevichii]PQJ73588.1 hypothetical protein BTO14_10060 [Polaribacter butkevichii]
MQSKYYKIIPDQLYKTNNQELIIEYLVENKICGEFTNILYTGEFEKTDVLGEHYSKSRRTKVYDSQIYSNEVINEFYSFLLTHYKAGLGKHIMFNLKLHEDTFGLKDSKCKKIALSYFEVYYNQIPINPGFKLKLDEVRNIIPATKFESLKRYKDCLFLSLENKSELIIPYLAGDDNYYNRDLFENNSMIKEIFEFENNLKILIELNKKFKFEEDDIFIPKTKAKIIFKEYNDQFQSLKQLQFIEEKLTIEENRKPSYIVSLYFFFKLEKVNLKIPKEKDFREILLDYFDLKLKRLKVNDSSNDKHQIRMRTIQNEWLEFIK